MPRLIKSLWDIAGEDLYKKIMSPDYVPEQTERAYKMFRTDGEDLYPLFVDSKTPVPVGEWQRAISGDSTAGGKVKSKIGPLAYRPGWHAGDNAAATHIGAKSDPSLKAPDTRRPEHVWAEIDMADDVDWQTYANNQGTQPRTKHVTDTVPYGGQYRYKTNSNMDGDWHIGGDMRVNRVLSDREVAEINREHGLLDLERREPSSYLEDIFKKYGAAGGATTAGLAATGQSEDADAGAAKSLVEPILRKWGDDIAGAAKELEEKVGFPESVANRIASGELPMDEASREARAGLMGMTNDTYYRGHPSARPPTSNDDMFVAKERRDIAETYASGGEAYDEATDSYIELPGEVTPLRTNASKFIEADGMGDDWTYPVAKIPGIGEGVGTDEIAALTKQSRERYGNDLQGSLFTNIRDDIGGELPPGDIANILGSQPEVKIRHADKAAFDPEYTGPNIMGGLLAGGVGLGALGQSEDADAGPALAMAKGIDLDRLVGAWQKRVSKQPEISPETHLQNIMHDKNFVNYNDWATHARKQDGGKNGETYFAGLKPMLMDISKHAKVGKDKRLMTGLTKYAKTRFTDRKTQGFQKGSADPNTLAGTAAGTAGLLAAGLSDDSEAGTGGLLARQILDGFDPRFDPRKNEADRINSLTTEKLDSGIEVPRMALQDMEGREFVTSMSDRTDSGGLITNIKGVELEKPLLLRGGQGYMFENPGKVWASGKTPVTQLMNAAGGKDMLFAPWRMAPTGGDFANMTGEAMLSYARSNMTKAQKTSLDKMIGAEVAGWPGVNSDEAVEFWPTISDKMRKKLKNDMDVRFRNDGGLSKGEARLTVTDPDQINARDGGIMNIGMIHGNKPRITDNDHPSYPDAVPGEGLGRTDQDVGVLELLPEVVKERGIPDPLNPRTTDLRALQMKPYKGRVTDKVLRNLEERGVNIKAVGAPTADPGLLSAQLHNHDEGVDKHMRNLGIDPREDPMYDYGTLLPVRENIVTGRSEMAMPSMLRDMVRGLFDVAESRKSGVFRPDGLFEVL